jgi:hypothetical protein
MGYSLHHTERRLCERRGFVHVRLEVAIEAVTRCALGQIVALLDALEDFAHVGGTDRVRCTGADSRFVELASMMDHRSCSE